MSWFTGEATKDDEAEKEGERKEGVKKDVNEDHDEEKERALKKGVEDERKQGMEDVHEDHNEEEGGKGALKKGVEEKEAEKQVEKKVKDINMINSDSLLYIYFPYRMHVCFRLSIFLKVLTCSSAVSLQCSFSHPILKVHYFELLMLSVCSVYKFQSDLVMLIAEEWRSTNPGRSEEWRSTNPGRSEKGAPS